MTAAELFSFDKDIMWIREWILNHTGIVFPDHKISILEQRLSVHFDKNKGFCLQTLVKDLKNHPSKELINKVIEVATTNHTHFFREFDAINYLIDFIIPNLIHQNSIRLWSAAASSGEELYTICMALFNTLGEEKISRKFSFLGTDVNAKVVDQAEKGLYCTSRVEDVPSEYRNKWFKPAGLDTWEIDEKIKSKCMFRRLNLLTQPWPFINKFHVIFLRNILYYFDADTQRNLLLNLYRVTEPGGWLIISVTENIGGMDLPWVRIKSNVFQKPIGGQ